MWYNELLFVLMIAALIGMGVMALVVKLNMRSRETSTEKKTEAPEKTYEPVKKVAQKPVKKVQPEPEPAETLEISEALFKPIVVQAAEPEPAPMPDEALFTPPVEEPAEPAIEPPAETIDERPFEPPMEPVPEPRAEPPEPIPDALELRRQTEGKFFDLRYEFGQQNTVAESPAILDEAPDIELQEEEEEEHVAGVVTCPHCKSEVPQTLYCIYCGNTLTAKPHTAAK